MALGLKGDEGVGKIFNVLRELFQDFLIQAMLFCLAMLKRPVGLLPGPRATVGAYAADKRIGATPRETMEKGVISRTDGAPKVRLGWFPVFGVDQVLGSLD